MLDEYTCDCGVAYGTCRCAISGVAQVLLYLLLYLLPLDQMLLSSH
jgi:hypothetical protein